MALPLIEQRLQLTPERPGVYMMKDVRGTILYVGKASVLRNRLRTYFGASSNLPNKIQRMLEQLDDFECIVTDSEAEALLLENTLIKRYRPRYNARLKDDKTYPFLKIDLTEDFPRVYITRKVAKDGARYFGPFATAGTVLAASVAWLWSRHGHRVNLARFFQVTAVFLLIFVVQLVIYGFHELTEARIFPYSDALHWATEPYGPDGMYGRYLSYLLVALPLTWLLVASMVERRRRPVSIGNEPGDR